MNEYRTVEDLNAIYKKAADYTKLEQQAANDLFNLKYEHAKKLLAIQIANIDSAARHRQETENKISEELVRQGASLEQLKNIKAAAERVKALKADEKNELNKINKFNLVEKARIKKKYKEQIDAEKKFDKETLALFNQHQNIEAREKKKQDQEARKRYNELIKERYTKEEALAKMRAEGYESTESLPKENLKQNIKDTAKQAFQGFAKELANDIKEIAYSQTEVDTRLQGSKQDKKRGSYWKEMNSNITENIAMSPFVKQADAVNNLKKLVGQGIAYNVEQRAFLDTISSKIATTFESTDAALLKLVRIQQQDTTAARLGMESALTAFLNNMYETTEYMSQVADSIRASIYEASALMGAADATAFEYQIQKWMGSMYSVGMSDQAVQSIAGALGDIAAGKIDALTGEGAGNLVVMAANQAGLSIADILQDGLNDAETNNLLKAMVNYLGDIYSETKNSRVVSQQFANVYGLSASDLKAAANLAGSTTTISNQNLNYGGMIQQLNTMANTMYQRTSTGEMMENLFNNLQYSTAATIANSPMLYATYNIASMLDDVAGGISIPAFSVYGNMVDLDTTVADLMRVASVGTGLLGGIGKMIVGLGKSSGGGPGENRLLRAFGVSKNLSTVSRGTGDGLLTTATMGTSSSGEMVGNTDSSDVQNKTMGEAKESGDQQLAEAQDETNETKLSTVDEHIMSIYNLLSDVTAGSSSLHVTVDDNFIWTQSIPSGI